MRILITGGIGFTGSHVIDHFLKNTDWDIVALDSISYAGDLNRLTEDRLDSYSFDRLRKLFFVYHDLRSPINKSVESRIGKVDYIIHIGAETHVDRSIQDSTPFVLSNVLGTVNLLDWAKEQKIKKYIQFSTDEVYGSAPKGITYTEEQVLNPSNPYSASKASGDLMTISYIKTFGIPAIITRCANIIGERQHPEKFVPKSLKATLSSKKVVIHGFEGDLPSRGWIHARNVASAVLCLLEKGVNGEIYNIPGEEHNVYEIAQWIHQMATNRPFEVEFMGYDNARPGLDKRYSISGEKLRQLGWVQSLNLRESLEKTIKFTIEHPVWLEGD